MADIYAITLLPESSCTSDKLYFEPLTVEDVLSIYEKEKPGGTMFMGCPRQIK